MYKVEWTKTALKSLVKIDQVKAKKIKREVETVLVKNPHKEGKPLKGNLKGLWRFRFSEYRVIYWIFQSELVIEVVEAGHRSDVYN